MKLQIFNTEAQVFTDRAENYINYEKYVNTIVDWCEDNIIEYHLQEVKDLSIPGVCIMYIYLDTLTQLIELKKLLNKELIITEDYNTKAPLIEIYDYWRE